jgi:hypothetical protein
MGLVINMPEYSAEDDKLLLQAAFSRQILRARDLLLYYVNRLDETNQWRPQGAGLVFIDGCDPFKMHDTKGNTTFWEENVTRKGAIVAITPPPGNLPADQNDGDANNPQPQMRVKDLNVNLANCLLYGLKCNIHIQPSPNNANHTQIGWLVDLDELLPKIIPEIIRSMELQYRAQGRDATKTFQMRGTNNYLLGKVSAIVGHHVSLTMDQDDNIYPEYMVLHDAVEVQDP